jgi:protein-S-isoprenylcysteine O-methyltransferase Ste14
MKFDPLGKSPLPLPAFLLSKFFMLCCWLFFIVKMKRPDLMLYTSDATETLGIVLYIAGFTLLLASLVQLGHAASVGLPRIETKLQTRGFYSRTRNPVYLGAVAMCLGSCVYAMHPLNFLLFAGTLAFHHRIVLKEEAFLANNFGHAWEDYRARVPRYFGCVRKQGNAFL